VKKGLLSTLFPTPRSLAMPALGVDISDRAIKYAAFSPHHYPKLAIFGEERITPGVVEGGAINDQSALTEALRRVKSKSKADFVHAALPEEKAYVVEVDLPAGDSKLARETIELHLDEHIPLEPMSAIFELETIDSRKAALSAIEQNLAEDYYKVLNDAQLQPVSFELESHALARALVPSGSLETCMIVDIGRNQSNLSIISGGLVRLAASIDMGGDLFTKAIVDDLQVSPDEARGLKEEEGLLRRGRERSAYPSIVRVATILRDEIYQRFTYWNSAHKETSGHVDRVFICGGNASIPGLAGYLGSEVDVAVSIGNPWVNVASFDEFIPEIPAREALKYTTAIGLALRNYEPSPI